MERTVVVAGEPLNLACTSTDVDNVNLYLLQSHLHITYLDKQLVGHWIGVESNCRHLVANGHQSAGLDEIGGKGGIGADNHATWIAAATVAPSRKLIPRIGVCL